jgi:membrane protein YqaA with SNARE-associated domain
MLKSLVIAYGSLGLFASSLLGSTIFFPFAIEILFLPLMKAGVNGYWIVLSASTGSVIGTYINYIIGWYGLKITRLDRGRPRLDKIKKTIDRYGWFGLFIIFAWPLPLPVDPLAIFIGITKMDWRRFIATVFTAKVVRYSLAVGLFSLI